MNSLRTLVACSVLAFVAAAACSDLGAPATCVETRTCVDDVAAGDGGGGSDGSVVAPPGCDLTKAPKDAPSCVDDGVGVFASPTGSDGAAGTKAAPVKSIGKAVELAASKGLPRVYVCEGTYDANVEVKSAVAIYGGLACGTWTYTGTKPKLAPPKGVALKVTKVSGPVVVEDLEVVGSADASVAGDSAIAVFVSESGDVRFGTSAISAGPGTPGAKGGTRSNYSAPANPGGLTNTAAAGMGPSCSCLNGSSSKGGAGANGAGAGIQDGSATPAVGAPNSGASRASSCDPGTAGANGNPGTSPAQLDSPGALLSAGWSSRTDAAASGDGNPAQGGGGGGGRSNLNIGGGGGGCGGCGGAGGAAGIGGGISVALLSYRSAVSISGGSLVSSVAGAGGEGGAGQPGQEGGAAGEGDRKSVV